MKLKLTGLFVAALSFAPLASIGQEKKSEEPAAEAKAWVPSTPLEKQAKGIADLMKTLPGIISSIKDQATMDKAKTSMTALVKKLDAHVVEIKKLPVPDNATKKALSDQMEKETASLGDEMQKATIGMASLPPELGPQVQAMMMEFGNSMQKHQPDMTKYFEPDEESKEGEDSEKGE